MLAVDAVLVVTGVLLLPSVALAWGPGAHLDVSSQILSGAAVLTPAVRALLRHFPQDFLYGSLAADHVVGKNLAADHAHCHSWPVALRLFFDSHSQPSRHAFMLGYIGHLAADIVAHNHFVPKLMVSSYTVKGAGHLYWEARFDHALMMRHQSVFNAWKELEAMRFADHDKFLATRLVSPVFSHGLSRYLFQKSMRIQRHRPWYHTMRSLEARSLHRLGHAEIELWRRATFDMVALALNEPESLLLTSLDPTGKRALAAAFEHRKDLRRSA